MDAEVVFVKINPDDFSITIIQDYEKNICPLFCFNEDCENCEFLIPCG
jgi:hypothetical protein